MARTKGGRYPRSQDQTQQEELLELHSDQIENEVQEITENSLQTRNTRGKTYMPSVWMMRGRKRIQFNNLGQPIGENRSKFVEFLGSLIRNGRLIRLDIATWHKVDEDVKKSLLKAVEEKFHSSHGFRQWTLMNMGKK